MDSQPQPNQADLPLVTLDNNALIALRNDEPDAPAVREILEMNLAGLIAANVTTVTGMEAQRDEERLDWQGQRAWIESLGIARDHIHTGPLSIGFSVREFPDGPTFAPWLEDAFAERLHKILHPEIPFMWREYRDREADAAYLTETQKRALRELDDLQMGPIRIPPRPTPGLDALSSGEREELERFLGHLYRKWFNAKNDSEGLLIHISQALRTTYPERAVFVTSDKNFRKQTKLQALRALNFPGQILRPAEAVTFLRTVTGMPSSAESES